MKKLTTFLILAIVVSSCTHRIVRTGYTKMDFDDSNCDLAVQRTLHDVNLLEKVGEVRLGRSWLSTQCSEADAIRILREEGCSLQADIVFISQESRPDIWSKCYRCTGEFYKYTQQQDTPLQDQDKRSVAAKVERRTQNDKLTGILLGTAFGALGFIIGFMAVQ
jgi:hypothetical protein